MMLRPSLNRASPPLMLTGLPGAGAQNVLGTVVGALIFPDFRFHPLNVVGLALGMAGAVWYATQAALKVREHRVAGCKAVCGAIVKRFLLGSSAAAKYELFAWTAQSSGLQSHR